MVHNYLSRKRLGFLNAFAGMMFLLFNIEQSGTQTCVERALCEFDIDPGSVRACECDEQCNIFGDCCVDASGYITELSGYNLSDIQDAVACDTSEKVYIVSKCPNDTHEPTKQLCGVKAATDDVLASVRVTGVTTGLVFKNMYCALCHGANFVERLLFWKVAFDCYDVHGHGAGAVDDPESVPVTDTLSTADIRDCFRDLFQPEEVPSPRGCRSLIDTCSADWTDPVVASECISYNNYTKRGDVRPVYFKNWHCAECNYVPEDQLSCELSNVSGKRDPFPPSMRHLLDLNQGYITHLKGNGPKQGLKQVGEAPLRRKCPENTVLDIFQDVCRSMFCEDGSYIAEGGKCRLHKDMPDQNRVFRDFTNLSRASNLTCVLTHLNSSEYEEYTNGTLHVPALNLFLHPGDYVSLENGSQVAICAHHFSQRLGVAYRKPVEKYLAEQYLTIIGYTISLIGLLTLFIIYTLLPELRNLPGKCLMNLVAALFLAQLLFLLINTPSPRSTLCKVFSAVTHLLYLAAFFWMNVLGFDIWRTFQFKSLSYQSQSSYKRAHFYHVYAWGMPLLIVSVALLVDEVFPVSDEIRPRYGENLCWFNTKWGLLYFFAVPVGMLLVGNIVFFTLAIYSICRTTCATRLVSSSVSKKGHLLLNIKLSAIMGLTWTFGFLANVLPDSSALWYAFVISGSLQGVVICLGFACNQNTFRLLKSRNFFFKEMTSSSTTEKTLK